MPCYTIPISSNYRGRLGEKRMCEVDHSLNKGKMLNHQNYQTNNIKFHVAPTLSSPPLPTKNSR